MDKSPDAFRTISEVAEWLGVQAHVLRFWESKFAQVKPVKRAGGRRYYRPADMLLLGGIKKLLHEDGLTVKGTQKILREQGVAHVSDLSQELCDVAADTALKMVEEAKVVPFKGEAAAPAIEEIAAPAVAQKPAAQPEAPVVEAEQVAPDDEVTKEVAEDAAEAPPAQAEEEQPMLPSFLHRPAAVAATQSNSEPTPEPVAKAKPSLVVDAPDPPDESDLPYTRGALAHLSRMKRLNVDQAAQIAPLAKELQGWLDRLGGAGAS